DSDRVTDPATVTLTTKDAKTVELAWQPAANKAQDVCIRVQAKDYDVWTQYQFSSGGCAMKPCGSQLQWCQSSCSCALSKLCPPGDIPYQCECCALVDYMNGVCLVCDAPMNVFSTYCPGG